MFVTSEKLIETIKAFIQKNTLYTDDENVPYGMERRIDINTKTIVLAEKDSPLPLHHRPYSYEWYMALIELDADVKDVDLALDYDPRKNLFKFVEREDAPTAKNALIDIKKIKTRKFNKNGEICSKIAEVYLNKLNNYSDYAINKMSEKWKQEIEAIALAAGKEDINFLANILDCYEEAGKIMKRITTIKPEEWLDLIGKLFDLDRNMPLTAWLVTRYSPHAVKFIEYVFDHKTLEDLPDISVIYLDKWLEKEAESYAKEKSSPKILQFPGNCKSQNETQPTN